MKTWWLVVRLPPPPHELARINCECEACRGKSPGGEYPLEGFAISAFDDEGRAKLYAKNATTATTRYEAVPVVGKSAMMLPSIVRPVYPIDPDDP